MTKLEMQIVENTTSDCISREEAKQFLYEKIDRLNDELYDIFSQIIDDMYNELHPITPSVKAIPLDKVELIRAEIEERVKSLEWKQKCVDEILEIIDKAIKEVNNEKEKTILQY